MEAMHSWADAASARDQATGLEDTCHQENKEPNSSLILKLRKHGKMERGSKGAEGLPIPKLMGGPCSPTFLLLARTEKMI